jgi:hypothetical protein
MKIGLILLILCCTSQDNGVYKYKTKNLQDTAQVGTLWSIQKHTEGDTVKL